MIKEKKSLTHAARNIGLFAVKEKELTQQDSSPLAPDPMSFESIVPEAKKP